MSTAHIPPGRRERAKQDKRERIMLAARELFAQYGISGVTTQQIADEADVAIGTLYLYASTKAELLIMVQNQKFAAAIDDGLASVTAAEAPATDGRDAVSLVMMLIRPVVVCVREHAENGRTYLHELVFGDPTEPYRREGLALAARLEAGISTILERDAALDTGTASLLARVITAIMHISTTATVFLPYDDPIVLADIRDQIAATLMTDHLTDPATHPVHLSRPLSTSL